MKKIYYTEGPESLTAGQAGTFRIGQSKPVSDRLAELLLGRTDITFKEVADGDVPADETIDLAAAEQAAIADDNGTPDTAPDQAKKKRR